MAARLKRLKKQLVGRRKLIFVIVTACLVLLIGLGLRSRSGNTQPAETGNGPVGYSTERPDEGKPNYIPNAKPDEPKYIRLPSIAAEGYVQKVGIDQHKQIAVPTNIHLAGWYVKGAKPGQPGLSIIDGHVDGLHDTGIFFNLKSLRAGDTYEVTLGNNSKKRFRVISVSKVDNDNAANVLFSQKPAIKSQLNLITCGGSFDKRSGNYNQRVIVTSELVK